MANITTRAGKGAPLTNAELDANFSNINAELGQKLTSAALVPYLTISAANAAFQPLDPDLSAIAGLTGTTGLLRKTAADTWTLDTTAYITSAALAPYLTSTTAASTYLPLSGGALNGQLTINGVGTASSPTLRLNTSSSSAYVHTQENLASGLTSGQHAIFVFGKEANTKNSGYIGYHWAGAASDSNYVTIGHWGADNLLRVYGNGNATVGTSSILHAGNYNSYSPSLTGVGASGTWNIGITGNASGTSTASYGLLTDGGNKQSSLQYFQGNNRPDLHPNSEHHYALRMSHGDAETYYSATIALNFFADALYFRRKVNGVNQDWRTVLHDGNYTSYALPLSGGSISGAVTVNGGANSIIAQDNGGAGDWRGRIISRNSTYDRAAFLGIYNGNAGVFVHNHPLNAWADLYLNTSNGTDGGTVRMPSSALAGGHQILHAGNYLNYANPAAFGNTLVSRNAVGDFSGRVISAERFEGGSFHGKATIGTQSHGIAGNFLFNPLMSGRMFTETSLFKVEATTDSGSSWSAIATTPEELLPWRGYFTGTIRNSRYGGFPISGGSTGQHVGRGKRFTFGVGYKGYGTWLHSGNAAGNVVRLKIEALNSSQSLLYSLYDGTYGGYPDDITFHLEESLDNNVAFIRVTYIVEGQYPGGQDSTVGMGIMLGGYATGSRDYDNAQEDRALATNRVVLDKHFPAYKEMGCGIAFPSTQHPSTDPNTLDDYEEGTWTPTLNSNEQYDYRQGTYIKIGRLVTVFWDIAVLGANAAQGQLALLHGLPFTVGTTMAGYSRVLSRDASLIVGGTTGTLAGFAERGANYLYLQVDGIGTSGFATVAAAYIGASGRWTGTCTYTTNS